MDKLTRIYGEALSGDNGSVTAAIVRSFINDLKEIREYLPVDKTLTEGLIKEEEPISSYWKYKYDYDNGTKTEYIPYVDEKSRTVIGITYISPIIWNEGANTVSISFKHNDFDPEIRLAIYLNQYNEIEDGQVYVTTLINGINRDPERLTTNDTLLKGIMYYDHYIDIEM